MSKSPVLQFIRRLLPGTAVAAGLLCSFTVARPAVAADITLCPSSANAAGINATFTDVPGSLDGSCGANSAVTMSINHSTDYARLAFVEGGPGYPVGLTLGNMPGLLANVSFTGSGAQPFYMLAFTDGSNSLGQTNASDQILMIEFQPSNLSGNTMVVDPSATQFNLFDNTSGIYLQGGQAVTNTVAGWLAEFSSLNTEDLQQIRIGMGLTGGDTGPMTLTVESLTIPEPASLALITVALAGIGLVRRGRGRQIPA